MGRITYRPGNDIFQKGPMDSVTTSVWTRGYVHAWGWGANSVLKRAHLKVLFTL